MPTRHLQADGSIRFEDEQGKATLVRVRSGVVLMTCSGYLKKDFFAPLSQYMSNELQLAGIHKKLLVVIADCWDLKGIDSHFRELWVGWFQSNGDRIATVIGLLRSKLMVMAVNIMQVFLGAGLIRAYTDLAAFESAVEDHVPGLGWGRRVRLALGAARVVSRRTKLASGS